MYICTYIYIHKYIFTHMNVYICHTTNWPICISQLSHLQKMDVFVFCYCLCEHVHVWALQITPMTHIRARSPPPSINQYTPPRSTLPAQLRCICTLLNTLQHAELLRIRTLHNAATHYTTLQHAHLLRICFGFFEGLDALQFRELAVKFSKVSSVLFCYSELVEILKSQL